VGGALTTSVPVTMLKPPPSSVTLRATVYTPAVAKLWLTLAPPASALKAPGL
jgi:hypothetical protein